MPNEQVFEAVETAQLIQVVDGGRGAADPFKLPAALLALVNARLSDLLARDAATLASESSRVGAQMRVEAAKRELAMLLRSGHDFIKALPPYAIDAPTRMTVFTIYGWNSGLIGNLDSTAHLMNLARQSVAVTNSNPPLVPEAAHRYPAQLQTLITAQLGLIDTNDAGAESGSREEAIQARDAALLLLELADARVRYFYCSASDETDRTPELAKIGFQPRRLPGEAEPQPLPGEFPYEPNINAATLEISVEEKPPHATTLRAFRQPLGGEAEQCGVSPTLSVSFVQTGPLTPGVTYDLWLVGHNSRGDGPQSERVSFVAPG